jgi:hypothetical protein
LDCIRGDLRWGAAGPGLDDPQLRDNHGVNFRINDPPLVIGEVQYIWNGKKGDPGLDGKFKVGGWRHFGEFSDSAVHRARYLACEPWQFGNSCKPVGKFRDLFGVRAEDLPRR